jgi:hypothetical protein
MAAIPSDKIRAWFDCHKVSPAHESQYAQIVDSATSLASAIVEHVPEGGTERGAALRMIRESVLLAHAALIKTAVLPAVESAEDRPPESAN